jgi:hypothetical protein
MTLNPTQRSIVEAYARAALGPGASIQVWNERFQGFRNMVMSLPNCRELSSDDVINFAADSVFLFYDKRRRQDEGAGSEPQDLSPALAAHIAQFLESLPRSYLISLDLPSIQNLPSFELTISDQLTLCLVDRSGNAIETAIGKAVADLHPTTPAVQLRVKVSGFATSSLETQGTADALALIKQFAFLLETTGNFERSYSHSNRSLASWLDVTTGETESLVLPDRLSAHLGGLKIKGNTLQVHDPSGGSLLNFRDVVTDEERLSALEIRLGLLARFYSRAELPGFARLTAAIEWYEDSLTDDDQTMAFLAACIGLESIFGEEEGLSELTGRLVDRYAFMLGKDRRERAELALDFQAILKLRGKLVHARSSRLRGPDRERLDVVRAMLWNSIQHELRPFTKF